MNQLSLHQTSLHCNALFPLPLFETEHSTSFLIGQYELEGEEHRAGQIDLVSLQLSSPSSSSDVEKEKKKVSFECKVETSLPLPQCGVFDIVPIFNQQSSSQQKNQQCQRVAAGCTDGAVKILSISKNNSEDSTFFGVKIDHSFKMGQEMVTSCFVFDHNHSKNDLEDSFFVASTHHQGTISICPDTAQPDKKFSFVAHEYDAWSISPSLQRVVCDNDDEKNNNNRFHHDPNVFYSGGDDCKMKLWDLRMIQPSVEGDEDDDNNQQEMMMKCQSHCGIFGAGVVTIVPQSPTLLLVGSYDEHVYAIDTRMLASGGGPSSGSTSKPGGQKSVVSQLQLVGGGWRFREISETVSKNYYYYSCSSDSSASTSVENNSTRKKYFAVAAMQGGAQVFSFDSESNELETACWPGSGDHQEVIHEKAFKLKKKEDDDEEPQLVEPLIYDVCQLGQGGKFLGGNLASFATVSFYSNELRCWGVI